MILRPLGYGALLLAVYSGIGWAAYTLRSDLSVAGTIFLVLFSYLATAPMILKRV